ncbi:MAG: DUF3618 domain-containing protein [Thermomicrobiales bacterium]
MGQGADQVRRGEPVRLREGESVVIRPDAPGVARGQATGAEYRLAGEAVPVDAGRAALHAVGEETGSHADDPAAIEAEIARTRTEMSGTIDAIQQRLSPENLKEEAKETASELAEQAKQAAREAVEHAVHEARLHAREAIQDARDAVRDATIGRVEQMARTVGDTTEDARYGIVETIKQNPVPAALAGIGLAWLFMNRQSAPQRRSYLDERNYRPSRVVTERGYERDDRYRTYREDPYAATYAYGSTPTYGSGYGQGRDEPGMIDRTKEKVGHLADQTGGAVGRAGDAIGEAAGQAGDTVGRMAGQVGETASTLASQAQETAGNLAHEAQHRARRVEDQIGRTMQDNPLALGAVALALGTAVALAVPQTQREHELFGQARDTLVERAQGMAGDDREGAGNRRGGAEYDQGRGAEAGAMQ